MYSRAVIDVEVVAVRWEPPMPAPEVAVDGETIRQPPQATLCDLRGVGVGPGEVALVPPDSLDRIRAKYGKGSVKRVRWDGPTTLQGHGRRMLHVVQPAPKPSVAKKKADD